MYGFLVDGLHSGSLFSWNTLLRCSSSGSPWLGVGRVGDSFPSRVGLAGKPKSMSMRLSWFEKVDAGVLGGTGCGEKTGTCSASSCLARRILSASSVLVLMLNSIMLGPWSLLSCFWVRSSSWSPPNSFGSGTGWDSASPMPSMSFVSTVNSSAVMSLQLGVSGLGVKSQTCVQRFSSMFKPS